MRAWRRRISVFLILVLLLSVLPAALAEETAESDVVVEAAEELSVPLPEEEAEEPVPEAAEEAEAPAAEETGEATVQITLPAEDVSGDAEDAAGSRNGWYKAGSNWYYYRSGTLVRSDWVKDGGKWYYFKSTGVMCAKEHMLMDNYVDYYLFGADGAMLTNRWVQTDSSWYSGSVSSSYRARMDNDWYYCGSDGRLYSDRWLKSGGYWYLFYGSGAMIRDEVYGDTGKYYYFDTNGHMVTGRWVNWNGWLYAGSDGVLYRNRWLNQGGKWYYFDSDWRMVAGGVHTVGGKRYLFSASGAIMSRHPPQATPA